MSSLPNDDETVQRSVSLHHDQHPNHPDHHVHFDQTVIKDDFESDNSIIYTKSGNSITVHLGFLQVNHRYNIELKVPTTVFAVFCSEETRKSTLNLVNDESYVPNINCKMYEFVDKFGHFDMKIEFFAHKEKLLKEELHLIDVNNVEHKVKLVFAARVLGRGKGTPMLRNGIHCTAVEADEESEASDWQGFSRTDTDEP